MSRAHTLFGVLSLASCAAAAAPPTTQPAYHIYAGNTHAHTSFTWSHGDQWTTQKPAPGQKNEPAVTVNDDGAQRPGKSVALKPDWQKIQAPPAAHFALAKTSGYDFYVTTDHSQEAAFQPPSPDNPNWLAAKQQAAAATDATFVALAGYEHSENNGPDGKGHLNVINSDAYLNALAPGVDLRSLYAWLKTAKPNGDGPVVASFNHPSAHSYNDFAYRDPEVTDVITMFEVINSNNKIHYDGFLAALDHGWKVSPVSGNDNHGLWGITHHKSRTFVLATALTKPAILDAMKHRRTYASLDNNLQCTYTCNGHIMGSTLTPPADDTFTFDISISDPDTDNPTNAITKVEILKDHGQVAETYTPPTRSPGNPPSTTPRPTTSSSASTTPPAATPPTPTPPNPPPGSPPSGPADNPRHLFSARHDSNTVGYLHAHSSKRRSHPPPLRTRAANAGSGTHRCHLRNGRLHYEQTASE